MSNTSELTLELKPVDDAPVPVSLCVYDWHHRLSECKLARQLVKTRSSSNTATISSRAGYARARGDALFWIVLFLPPPHRLSREVRVVVASGEKGESSFPLLRVRASRPREVGRHAGTCGCGCQRAGPPGTASRARTTVVYAMVAHYARDGGARPPQPARGPSRGADRRGTSDRRSPRSSPNPQLW